jgi:8-oxo-dGTP pyrophosphatase MutT (NUDIX family)
VLRRLIVGSARRSAAVAVVFRPAPGGAELLFVQRTRRIGDRWSGNVAFPGGLAHPEDADLVATARRETREETGLELGAPLRRLTPLLTAEPGRFRPMRVHPIVFTVPANAEVELNREELADAFWIAWRDLSALPRIKVWKRIKSVPFRARAVFLRGRLLWGLTFWMVEELRADRTFDPDAL